MATAPCAASSSAAFPSRPVAIRPRNAAVIGSVRARAGAVVGAGDKWWATLLGWSGQADYLEAPAPVPAREDGASTRRAARLLTEEKARELRARMAETECFHDAMYHSAIASRLARST